MGVVNNISLFRLRPTWARFDTTPFLILHGINALVALSWCSSENDSTGAKDNQPWWLPCRPPLVCIIAFPILIATQVLVHLGTYWSVYFRTIVTMFPVKDISAARFVKVQPRKLTEQGGICPLERITLTDSGGFPSEVAANYRQYCYLTKCNYLDRSFQRNFG
jgi:hypothetical protein